MVMEETPSPHIVGREFVRQYYTLLNQAPMHLHRFYNENSSFVHGGLDSPNRETEPVIGQRQIHHRIQQLDFNDCHAKIRQVDSQATLGSGVVVQVTGELSNNGEPMRRFTQTFVLAQQSPKKYYVHNDIFRYQDEMINDEESDAGLKDIDDVMEPTSQSGRSQAHTTIGNFYPANNQMTNGGTLPPQHIKPVIADVEKPPQPQRVQKPKVEAPVEEKKVTEMRATIKDVSEVILSEPGFTVGKGPKTYATLVKSGSQVPTSFANIMSAAAQVLPVVDASTYPPIQSKAPSQPLAAKNLPPKSTPSALGPKPKPRLDERKEWKEPADVDKRRLSGSNSAASYPDSQQVFVGNVPLSASEQDIKDIFSKYGTVVDLRLNCKAPAKGQPGKIFPKYGFVIFSDAAAVKYCLQSRPITMPGDASHSLNIEEKRNRFRSGEERPGGGGGRGMGRGGRGDGGGVPPPMRRNDSGGRGGGGGRGAGGGGRASGHDNKSGGGLGRGGGGSSAFTAPRR